MADLLKLAPNTSAAVIERLALGLDGVPLEWRQSDGAASKFHYAVEVR